MPGRSRSPAPLPASAACGQLWAQCGAHLLHVKARQGEISQQQEEYRCRDVSVRVCFGLKLCDRYREREGAGGGICICIYEIKHKVRRRSSSAAHLAHMTAACSKGSGGGIFRKITKNQLNQARGRGRRSRGNKPHTCSDSPQADSLFKSAGKKKGNIFTYFQLNRKWKSRWRGRAGEREEERGERERKRACHDYHAISVNPKRGKGESECARLFPTCQPPDPAPPLLLTPLQPQLLSPPCCGHTSC